MSSPTLVFETNSSASPSKRKHYLGTLMKKKIGRILTGIGLLGFFYYGVKYFQDSETFEAFGADIAISTGHITPVIVSIVIILIGIVVTKAK